MQAIVTKFLGASSNRGSRVKVKSQAGAITVPWDHALDVEENHNAAVLVFLHKLGWPGIWVGGALPDDTGYAYVKVEGGIDKLPARISKRY